MKKTETLISDYIKKSYPDYEIVTSEPSWLRGIRWIPYRLLFNESHDRFLAIDVILSGTIPTFQYNKIVKRLLCDQENFRVVIIAEEEGYEENPEIESYCIKANIGLKIVIPGVGIQTVIRSEFDSSIEQKELPLEDGWFPRAILNQNKNLTRLCFNETIYNFIDAVEKLGNDKESTLELVHSTINELLAFHPAFKESIKYFMKLEHFEKLLKLSDPNFSDHVFHSFRVFLSGCPVINEFYDHFLASHKRCCIGPVDKLCVEYSWLLTAIFHDIGKPKEKKVAKKYVDEGFGQDEFLDISFDIKVDDRMWASNQYITAKRILGSLGAYVAQGYNSDNWDGGGLDDEESDKILDEWINIYDNLESHAVISAFDFFADIAEKCRAASWRKNKTFVLSHAAPAALAIMLHDWKKWDELRKLNLLPVDGRVLPMAALLIYIDTWDNYKRKDDADPLTYIRSYIVNTEGACVQVEWGDSSEMKDGTVGYELYQDEIENLAFALDINYGLVEA